MDLGCMLWRHWENLGKVKVRKCENSSVISRIYEKGEQILQT